MKTYKSILPEIRLSYIMNNDVPRAKSTLSEEAAKYATHIFSSETVGLYEEFMVLYLNRGNNTIGWYKVSQGGLSGTVVDVRLILCSGLQSAASGMIAIHNHPSGSCTPSHNDKKVTAEIRTAGEYVKILLLDHIIIVPETFNDTKQHFSFANEGLL